MSDTKSSSHATADPPGAPARNREAANGGNANEGVNAGPRTKSKSSGRASAAPKKLRTHAPTRSTKSGAKAAAGRKTVSGTGTAFPWLLNGWQTTVSKQFDLWRQSVDKLPDNVKSNLDQGRTALSDASDNVKESSLQMAEGLQNLNRRMIENFRDDFGRWMGVSRDLMDARDIGEATQIHTEFMRQCVQSYIQQSKEISELAMEAARETWSPFSASFAAYYDKLRGSAEQRSN